MAVNPPPKKNACLCLELPLTDYEETLDLQRAIVAARKAKRIDHDVVIILEHPPVFTLGRHGGRENLIVSEDFLNQRGIRVVQIERGGNITYHGPGQLVAYPILNLDAARLGVREYVAGLEEIMVRTAGDWGVTASGDPENRGVWIGQNKLGSIGIGISRGITFHGLALNVSLSLDPFTWINPCGLHNVRMTSMEKELSRPLPMDEVRESLKKHMGKILNRELIPIGLSDLESRMKQAA